MLMKKRCPRCGGNIYVEEDCFGCWGYCLQCGYECDPENMIKSPEQVTLSGMTRRPTQNVNNLTKPKVTSELLQGHLVAEL
jgi:hypothetical protein